MGASHNSELILKIKQMHCASCAQNIERHLKGISGINSANISFATNRGIIVYNPHIINPESIIKKIKEFGYDAETLKDLSKKKNLREYFPVIRVVLVGLFLLLSWITVPLKQKVILSWAFEDIFALIAVAIGWWPILRNAIKTILSKDINVDVLVSIAVFASLVIGENKAASTVIFIMLLGEFLENFTVGKTTKAVRKLMELSPLKVRVRRNGTEVIIKTEEIKEGDIVVIKAGERVAADGILLFAEAQIDQSVITGESMPVTKTKGENIMAGSMADGCYFEIKATRVGKNTTLAQIQKLVEQAQTTKAPVQRIVDKFASSFVPAVIIIAVLIYILTFDITRVITILIVACPCALIIATPVAVIAAIGNGARKGILIKGGQYLENLGRINTVVFDKTGTLTRGRPSVIEVKRFKDHTETEIIELAAIIESKSEHHLAQAIIQKAKELKIPVKDPDNVKIIKGKGIAGKSDNTTIYLGNLALMKENNIPVEPEIASYIQQEESKSHTALILAHDNEICGIICVSDELRPFIKETINTIRKLGIKNIWMMTGDNLSVADNVAKNLDLDKYFAEMLPEDKIKKIIEFQKLEKKVIMVGDGINDAPALVQADVGIAMGIAGTDIAIESSDVTLMKDDLAKIPAVIGLGHKAVKVIKQNLSFALGFNVIMFVLAGFGFIHIIEGAVFHQLNSLFVILNAMRLLKA